MIFPAQFSAVLGGQLRQAAPGASLREVLTALCEGRAALRTLLFLPSHELSPAIGFSLVGKDAFYSADTIGAVRLAPGDTVEVILPMAGG